MKNLDSYVKADGVYDARKLGLPKMGVLGVQHMFAMFGATILVPILTGLSPSATLLFAGLGTLLFHFLTKRMVPAFLGSSFAFLAGYFALTGLAGTVGYETVTKQTMLQYASIGVVASSVVYFIVAALVKACGVKTVMKFFPPVVTGPIIIGIGLVLAPVAVNSCTTNWPVALIAIATVICFSVWGRGMLKIIPILMGVIVSYVASVALGFAGMADTIDYSGVAKAAWIGLPVQWANTTFPVLANPDKGLLVTALAIVVPIAFATIMEHVGDVSAISSTVKRNYFANPGLHRTMLGDGFATALAALFGAPANTTYGENTGVLSLSKVYDPRVIRIAAIFAILVSFCPKFSAFIGTIPVATIGGVSFVLYGMISAVGVRNLVESQVDLGKSRNMLIAAIILVLTLGISFSKAGAISFACGGVTVSLSGLAIGALIGILLNAILPGKDFSFSETAPNIKDADRWGGKRIVCVCVAIAAFSTFADTSDEKPPTFWGFANYGVYSGYQLYGSIVNTEPVLQGYGEINANLPWNVGSMDDLGYFGFGLFSNSDLTGKRHESYRRAFNEFDFNFHWQKSFFLDDAKTWAVTYRSFIVWYYYPWTGAERSATKTTFDWDHYFELTNPYVIPYCCWVHEYAQSYGNLVQFGIKKPFSDLFGIKGLGACPFIEFVWRDKHYAWCFSNYGHRGAPGGGNPVGDGLSTMKLELDLTYQITSWFGVFAKVAYCQNIQGEMRDACKEITADAAYGRYNEFVWGGVGISMNF